MEIAAYILLFIVAVWWIVLMLREVVSAFPEGIIGLIAIIGIGLLFIRALADRLNSKEDDHYSNTVEK